MEEQAQSQIETPQEVVETQRPEWLPEKFNTPEDLATSYNNLESKLGQSEEELSQKIIESMEQEMLANRPASVGDYKIPEGLDESLVNDNGLFRWYANFAFENGFNQEEFDEGIQAYIKNQPNVEEYLQEQKNLLGDNAQQRIDAVEAWSSKFFPTELQEAVLELSTTATGIKALEYIQTKLSNNIGANNQTIVQNNEDDITSLMKDERYWNPAKRDPAIVKKVEQGWKNLYPDQT